ncbi:MAG TPA: hypothetical protein VGJ26_11430 [Pirellulales bacterium]
MPHSNGKRQATSQLSHARQRIAEASDDAVAAASGLASSAAGEIRDRVEAGQEKLHSIVEGALDNVRERPIRVVLAALGVGCLIGWMLKRR